MSEQLILASKTELTGIADAIRAKTGSTETMSLSEFSTEIQNLSTQETIISAVYPVGSIYMSVNNVSPQTLFGIGTWEQIEDTFLLAAGSTYEAGSTGGEATHTLTIAEMPAHRHQLGYNSKTVQKGTNYGRPINVYEDYEALQYNTTAQGDSAAHNNMPPYLSVYMWKRTA